MWVGVHLAQFTCTFARACACVYVDINFKAQHGLQSSLLSVLNSCRRYMNRNVLYSLKLCCDLKLCVCMYLFMQSNSWVAEVCYRMCVMGAQHSYISLINMSRAFIPRM